ncbi:type IV secretion system protein [Neoehrlichia mikurensis]|uniref:Type IV secretion system protein n=1 Tax=Neoehrlichia mikurensis TaxID=89586 RepID=A0A9Q9F4K1_9RICK|nr:type IV secretion system protein [Neoehrlichia mikurensis]QXK92309.1 type IV secretion system protein [Neoehrlichia mikurensis]QXK92763.1 type IV secretion system protein [Neoehrlichia mikurensis]QXK94004.1 type IV secretion system protein [Neoehrlichia mikurensis]UTO55833.1 type IV secretion system protein [Neoehrlichia mikurensis]UTO56748.1 type IV secretion system protein [Neoehrlichia mikurensis]
MFNFKNKTTKDKLPNNIDSQNWYHDRYSSIIVQRNILLLLVMFSVIGIGVSTFIILTISKNRTIEPFVVEIEKKSGITTLVNPISVKQYSADEVLNNYFIIEYIRARELFDPNNFQYNYYTKVRLFSTQDTYNEFRNWIRLSNPSSPVNLYANVASGHIKIRSLQHLNPGNVQIRFTLEFNVQNGSVIKKDRIATLSFQYTSLEMNEQQRQINPLGFQITYYRADDEFL